MNPWSLLTLCMGSWPTPLWLLYGIHKDVSDSAALVLDPQEQEIFDPNLSFSSQSLLEPLLRSLLGLSLIIVLLFVLSKWLAPKLKQHYFASQNQRLKLLEKLPLDGTHQLALVRLDASILLLLGSGPQGINLLYQLSNDSTDPHKAFEQIFAEKQHANQQDLVKQEPIP